MSRSGAGDIEVLESAITAISPEGLFLRGVALEQLLEKASFEEVAFLLWHGHSPSASELQHLRRSLARSWLLPPEVIQLVQQIRNLEPLAALQIALPLLLSHDPETQDSERRAARLLGQVPAVLALHRTGEPPPPLNSASAFAPQILRALGARELPESEAEHALILYADHELAASTFAARIAAAAHASLYDGMAAAVAVLKGPLHGGSLSEVAALLERLAQSSDVDAAIAALIAERRRIPGFGHSVYQGGDPRAGHFRRQAEREASPETARWLALAAQLEQQLRQTRKLYANVDLYAAIWMRAIGLSTPLMPGLFAVARTAGWTAHMLEQQANNRLIRPRARYTGSIERHWPL